MARLLTDGAESGDWSRCTPSASGSGAASGVTSGARTGNYCYYCKTGNASTYFGYLTFYLPATYSEWYLRLAFKSNCAGGIPIVYWNGGYAQLYLPGASSYVTMMDGGVVRATSSLFTFGLNEWHVFEFHVKQAASPNGIYECKFDGKTIISWTGATNNQAGTNYLQFRSGQAPSVYSYYDDIAFNDTSTPGVDDSWPGDGGVLAALVPNGVGNYSDLIASAGNAWDCVNEVPPSITDYVYESTVDKKSTYTLSDLAGLPAGASIQRVWAEISALQSAAEVGNIATLLRSGSADRQSDDKELTLAMARYVSPEYLVDPADDAAWDTTKVNALEAGAVVR